MLVKGHTQIIEPFTSCRGHPALCELPSKVSDRGWHPLPSPRALYKNPSHPDYILKPRIGSHRDIHTTRLDSWNTRPGLTISPPSGFTVMFAYARAWIMFCLPVLLDGATGPVLKTSSAAYTHFTSNWRLGQICSRLAIQ